MLYLLQVDGRKVTIDHDDSEISQGRGGKILQQQLLRPEAIHQQAKTAPTAEPRDHSFRSTLSVVQAEMK